LIFFLFFFLSFRKVLGSRVERNKYSRKAKTNRKKRGECSKNISAMKKFLQHNKGRKQNLQDENTPHFSIIFLMVLPQMVKTILLSFVFVIIAGSL